MSIKDKSAGRTRIVCTRMKEAGDCTNRQAFYAEAIERVVVADLKQNLGSRDAVGYFVRMYNDERQHGSATAIAARTRLETRLATATREIERTVTNLVRGIIGSDEAAAHLPGLRTEKAKLTAELATMAVPPKVVALHPTAVKAYLDNVARLEVAVADFNGVGDVALAQTLRDIIETVTVTPTGGPQGPMITIRGHLASLIEADAFPNSSVLGVRW